MRCEKIKQHVLEQKAAHYARQSKQRATMYDDDDSSHKRNGKFTHDDDQDGVKRVRTVARAAGGEIWTDASLLEWDPSMIFFACLDLTCR